MLEQDLLPLVRVRHALGCRQPASRALENFWVKKPVSLLAAEAQHPVDNQRFTSTPSFIEFFEVGIAIFSLSVRYDQRSLPMKVFTHLSGAGSTIFRIL